MKIYIASTAPGNRNFINNLNKSLLSYLHIIKNQFDSLYIYNSIRRKNEQTGNTKHFKSSKTSVSK